jgi:hypothetical protein
MAGFEVIIEVEPWNSTNERRVGHLQGGLAP